MIERGLILSSGSELELMDSLAHSQPFSHDMKGSFTRDLRGIERKQILEVLEASRWKIKGEGNAASRLGLKPSTLRSRMRRLDIERPD